MLVVHLMTRKTWEIAERMFFTAYVMVSAY